MTVALTTSTLVATSHARAAGANAGWVDFLLLVLSSGVASMFVLSLLHADLRKLYAALSEATLAAQDEARRDPLTGGQNRKAFVERVSAILGDGDDRLDRCLVFVDLDHFKQVNDRLGHEAGDIVLRQAFGRIAEAVGSPALYRLSGDEFAIIVEGAGVTITQGVCHDIRARVGQPYRVGDRACSIGCSLGIVAFDSQSVRSASDAMRKADIAMYKAKSTRSGVEVFDRRMLEKGARRAALGERLRAALDRDVDINTHFQTIVRPDGNVVAAEALIRWTDAEFGAIAPDEAISIAKEFRSLDRLSLYVVEQACEAARALPDLKLSINLEASQLFDTQFVSDLEAILEREQVPCERFIIEIGETDIAAHGDRIATLLVALVDTGFALAVDNFGSSTASLTFLARLGVTHVKVDRSVLSNARETGSIAIITAKIQLARSLGMMVTCEAVGDAEDEQIALQARSDFLQGYYYCLPQPLSGITADLARRLPLQRRA